MWITIISVCTCITLVMVLAFCLCWKRKTQKSEWLGPDGMITQKNPDENVNHLPSATLQTVTDSVLVSNENISNKSRAISVNNPRRRLPDIPLEGQLPTNGDSVTWKDVGGDNSSELYATVDDQNQAKRTVALNGIESRSNISQHSSISQADDSFSPYAHVNYDQLRQQEHPYARLHPTTNAQLSESTEEIPRTTLLRVENSSAMQSNEPVAPPRSRRSSGHSGGVDIPAASAVSGGVAASQELPYMTPPITQTNFSGDSQDSSKGYTSISVREPLANIIAQTKEMNKLKADLDPHYSTVSDDSDDVYTTIPDPNNPIYTSESETYARIPPLPITVEVEVNPVPIECNEEDEVADRLYEPAPSAPQPPSVDSLRQVAHSHSRQASSSSSVANLGSPKPEKRQANSPLPPPPAGSPELHLPKNIDDMYAKVHKNKKKKDKDEDERSGVAKGLDETGSRKSTSSSCSSEEKKFNECARSNQELNKAERFSHKEHNYETLRKSPKKCSDPGYEKIKTDEECSSEPGYACISGPDSIISSDPGYEELRQQAASDTDPNYEELRHRSDSRNGTEYNVNQSNLSTIMDGYSVVNKQKKQSDKSSITNNSSSYESDPRDLSLDEPNYESMPSESLSEHNYAALKSGSESDPNYESVNHSEPNYESVKYLDASLEPPYEHVNSEDSSRTDSDLLGYEKINLKANHTATYQTIDTETSASSNGSSNKIKPVDEPPYERLQNEDSDASGYEKIKINNSGGNDENRRGDATEIDINQSEPGYETIKNSDNLNNVDNSRDLLDPDTIFEV